MRQINPAGLEIIKRYEDWRDSQYLCPAGKPSIGWGHVIRPGEVFQEPISDAQGLALLVRDTEEAAAAVERLVKGPLNDNQFSALVSLTYNIGQGSLAGSTLLRLLNAGDYQGAADEFPKWRKAGGQVLAGLVKRRADERELFLTPVQVEVAAQEGPAAVPFQDKKEATMFQDLALKVGMPLLMKMLPTLISLVTPALKNVLWSAIQDFKKKAYETPNPVDNVLADGLESLVEGLGLSPADQAQAS